MRREGGERERKKKKREREDCKYHVDEKREKEREDCKCDVDDSSGYGGPEREREKGVKSLLVKVCDILLWFNDC